MSSSSSSIPPFNKQRCYTVIQGAGYPRVRVRISPILWFQEKGPKRPPKGQDAKIPYYTPEHTHLQTGAHEPHINDITSFTWFVFQSHYLVFRMTSRRNGNIKQCDLKARSLAEGLTRYGLLEPLLQVPSSNQAQTRWQTVAKPHIAITFLNLPLKTQGGEHLTLVIEGNFHLTISVLAQAFSHARASNG